MIFLTPIPAEDAERVATDAPLLPGNKEGETWRGGEWETRMTGMTGMTRTTGTTRMTGRLGRCLYLK